MARPHLGAASLVEGAKASRRAGAVQGRPDAGGEVVIGLAQGSQNSMVCWTHTKSYKLFLISEPHSYVVKNFTSHH